MTSVKRHFRKASYYISSTEICTDESFTLTLGMYIKGIVHFEIKIWYLSAYPKGIQDVGVFFFFSRSNFDVFRSNCSSLSAI